MSINFLAFVSPAFWLDLGPQPPSTAVSVALLALFAILVAAGILIGAFRRHAADKLRRVLLARVSSMLTVMGLIGWLLFFFHYEQIRFFGARFWFLLWAAGLVAWIVVLVRFARVDMARMRGANAVQRERSKYLPKKNH